VAAKDDLLPLALAKNTNQIEKISSKEGFDLFAMVKGNTALHQIAAQKNKVDLLEQVLQFEEVQELESFDEIINADGHTLLQTTMINNRRDNFLFLIASGKVELLQTVKDKRLYPNGKPIDDYDFNSLFFAMQTYLSTPVGHPSTNALKYTIDQMLRLDEVDKIVNQQNYYYKIVKGKRRLIWIAFELESIDLIKVLIEKGAELIPNHIIRAAQMISFPQNLFTQILTPQAAQAFSKDEKKEILRVVKDIHGKKSPIRVHVEKMMKN
ncbi:MAG: hypothetical protein KDK51_09665, partial [Deltaproteobacteria bacterium]|nr:hypothetical protein [Deltaproteobacteria bacterium]